MRTVLFASVAGMVLATAAFSASKPATVDGKVVRDGRPVVREIISLYRVAGKKETEIAKTKTGARGNFVFRQVKPGSYTLGTGVFVPKQQVPKSRWIEPGLAGLSWDKPCRAASPDVGTILNAAGSDKQTGELKGFIASVGLKKPFKARAGDHITKTLAFTCK